MFIVRYRTHGPEQQETFPDIKGTTAYARAEELAKSYSKVSMERRSDMVEWKDGERGSWHND